MFVGPYFFTQHMKVTAATAAVREPIWQAILVDTVYPRVLLCPLFFATATGATGSASPLARAYSYVITHRHPPLPA